MRVLLTGATGFIGQALARALLEAGHELVCAVRDPSKLDLGPGPWRAFRADFTDGIDAAWWMPHLEGIDAVVNAVGILREAPGQRFDVLHARAPIALFTASQTAGVRAVIQVSALGADDQAQSRYHLTKKQADDALRALPLAGAVVQPSVVYGDRGESAAMFNAMASAPMLAMPQGGRMPMQPVHVDDVVAGILALLQAPPPRVATMAFVGPERLTMAGFLRALRHGLGLAGGLPVLPLPTGLFMLGARIAARLPGSILDTETAGMLLRGNAAPVDDFRALLGRAPRAVDEFIPDDRAPALRAQAVLQVWQPVLRGTLALAWVGTGIAMWRLTSGTSLIMFALAGLTLSAPPRRRRQVWLLQGLLAALGLLIAALSQKTALLAWGLPVLAVIGLMYGLEPRVPGPWQALPASRDPGPADRDESAQQPVSGAR